MKRMWSSRIILIILIASLLFWACSLYFIRWNTKTYQQEATNAIAEVVLQVSESISCVINGELRVLEGIAKSITEIVDYHDWEEIKDYLNYFVDKYDFIRISINDIEGIAHTSDGAIFEVHGERGYAAAMQGRRNISAPLEDKVLGKEIITFNIPIRVNDNIVGVLSASRYTKELYDILGDSFYNGQGFSQIIDPQGNIILRSPHPNADLSFDNIFDAIERDRINEGKLEHFQNAVRTNQSGIEMISLSGEQKLVGYHPIHEVNGWYTLSVIPEQVILAKAFNMSSVSFLLCITLFIILVGIFIIILLGRKKVQKEIEKIAYVDELTQLPRMNKFRMDAQQLIKGSHKVKFAMVYMDVDQFKYINEVIGLQEGNRILIHLARTIEENKSDADIIGRVSGDQFIMMTSYDNRDELSDRIHHFIEKVSEYKPRTEEQCKLIINCGIYCVVDHQMDIQMMIDRAEIACKAIKGGYSSAYAYYDEELLAQSLEELDIVNKMESAMKQDEFKVLLQPKVNVHTSQLTGAEALVRWEDPVKGLLSPDLFIPIFERNRFIMQFDYWVFEQVCRILQQWLREGITPPPISVNLSLATLFRNNLAVQLQSILLAYGIPAQLIELELTETIVFKNIENVRKMIVELKSIGFSIAIDDFGTGYSSLNVLQHIPADVVKLDRGFLTDQTFNETGKIVIDYMVKLARKLNMKVVAEGVETQEQVEFLREVDCEIAQGYYYAKPMTIDNFELLLQDRSL